MKISRLLVVMLIEDVEDFLEKRGIDIPNEEKKDSEDPSTIYGSDFAELEDYFEHTLDAYDIQVEEEFK